MATPKSLSCTQAGQVLAVSGITIRRLAQLGKIECYKTTGGNYEFEAGTIRQLASGQYDLEMPSQPVNQAMIISDDKSSSESLASIFKQWENVETKLAEDAFDAGVLLNQISPDVIILDQKFQDDSLAIIRKIKKNPDLKDCIGIVLVDSLKNVKDESPTPIAHFMEKPLNNADLAELIRMPDNSPSEEQTAADGEEYHSEVVEDFLEELYIPAPPDLFLRVRQAVPNLRKISSLVEEDPGLTSKILQAVNSVAFGLPNKVASLPNAVSLLGLDYILNIINAVLIRKISKNVKSADLEVFWNISNEVGQYSAFLSRKLCLGTPDEAFTLGLFHNCGVPLILEKYPDYFNTMEAGYGKQSGFVEQVEMERYGNCHSEVSYLIARAWNLPLYIVDAIHHHHDPEKIFEILKQCESNPSEHNSKTAEYIVLLKVAEHFAELHLNLGKQNYDHEWEHLKPAVLDYLGMDNDGFADLEDEVDISYSSIFVR